MPEPTLRFTCPNCSHQFGELKTTTSDTEAPQYGDILLCSFCGQVNIVKLLSLEQVPDNELLLMPEAELKELQFAQRVIKQKYKENLSKN